MNMKHNKNTVKNRSAHSYSQSFMQYAQMKYVRELIVAVILFALVSCGYALVTWYQKSNNVQAFAGLVEISKSYEKALEAARNQQELPTAEQVENPFEDTELLLEAIATQHTSSSLSPFFVFYQADVALQKESDLAKATTLMKKGLAQLPKKSIYYDMFHLKLIKMSLDSKEEAVVTSAVQDLKLMADNNENYYYQEALHTLAMYQASQGDMSAAIVSWKKLATSQTDKALVGSPFVAQAQDKLKSLHIDMNVSN